MLTRRRLSFTLSLLLTVLMAQLLLSRDVQAAGPNSITTPDTVGDVGSHSSVVLDSTGNPVIAYYDEENGDLKVMHCNDANCAGNDESITNPDNAGTVGREPSLVLDANGYPVISYNEANTYILKLMHCNDVNCAGGDESTAMLINRNGWQSSLLLDAAGYPVISVYNYTERTLTIIHCSDANCTGAKSTTNPDTNGDVGASTSLQLDANGFPVVSYYDVTNGGLKILHCNDVNCDGGGESITKPDATPLGWQWGTSLELDSNGYPVISYLDYSNDDLKVMHCNDVNCAGNDESIVSVDTSGMTGYYSSLELDASGYPVISTLVIQGSYIRVIHCNDANCAGGDESITQPDTITNAIVVGTYTSLVLDANGYPVVSYYEPGNGDLKVLHCANANCTANSAPVANNDSYSTNESTALTLAAPGVLGNDSDADGNALTALIVVNPTHGTVVLNPDGSFIYTPVTGYYGLDSFTYKANDGTGDSNVATVSLTVNAVNDAPVATNDNYITNEDTPLALAAPGVLGNDSDPENATLTALIVSNPAHGTVTLNADGSFSYTPAANYNGADSFTYMANDGTGDSNVATVSLTVNAVNDAPVATNDSYSTNEDTVLTVAAPGVLGNDSDVEGSALTASVVIGPNHGTTTLNTDGSFTYTPALNYSGPDSFTYKVTDGALNSNIATVNLSVTPVEDIPSYAVDNTDNGYSQIVIIDPLTGVVTPFGARQALDIEDVALHPTTGVLYASTGGNGTQKGWLYRVDRTTGVLTAIGQTDSKGVMALTFRASDATLWGWVEGTGLIQINLTTAKSTVITKNSAKFEGLAWAANGKLYLARDKTLTEYNPTNQTFTTFATNLPKGTESLDTLPTGRLVGGARDSKITLFSYNLTTKQIISTKTLTGATGFAFKSIEGLTWHASLTPPPGF